MGVKTGQLELSVVLPVFNEEESIGAVVRSWVSELDRLGVNYEFLIYDDGSTDGTAQHLEALSRECPRAVLQRHENRGHGRTVLRGYREAQGDWVFQLDSDDEIDSGEFEKIWSEREAFDMLLGVRVGRNPSLARRIVSAAARSAVSVLFDGDFRDVNVPFRLMRRERLHELMESLPSELFAPNVVLAGLAARHRLRIREVSIAAKGVPAKTPGLLGFKIWRTAAFAFLQTLDAAWRVRKVQPFSRVGLLILVGFAICIALTRLHTIHEPLERDLAVYALIGDGLLQGRSLYTDLWDHKPPAIYLAYAAAQWVVGEGSQSIYSLGVGAAVVTLLGVYWAASAGGRGPLVGLIAAAFWTAVSGDLDLQANQPNTEVFINACLIWYFALLVRRSERRGSRLRAALCGLLLGTATLFKPIALVFGVMALVGFLPSRERRAAEPSDSLQALVCFASVSFATILLPAIYFSVMGRFDDYWGAVVLYNRFYGRNLLDSLAAALSPQLSFHACMHAAYPLLGVVGVSLLFLRWWRPPRSALVLAAYGAAAWVAVSVPGRFLPHYYQLWLPVLSVAAAWGLHAVGKRFLRRSETGLPSWALDAWLFIAGGLVAGWLVQAQLPAYSLTPNQWSERKYGPIFVDSYRVAEFIDALLREDESFFAWSAEPELYLHSRRAPPAGVLLRYPMLDGPLAGQLSERLIRTLDADPPDLFVVTGIFPPSHPVFQWFDPRYGPAPGLGSKGPFQFHVLRGSELESRLVGHR